MIVKSVSCENTAQDEMVWKSFTVRAANVKQLHHLIFQFMMPKINISIVGILYQLFFADFMSNLPTIVIMFRDTIIIIQLSSQSSC